MASQISCDNCTSACCRKNTVLDLNKEEYEFLKSAPTDLSLYREEFDAKQKRLKDIGRRIFKLFNYQEHKLFNLDTDCGWQSELTNGHNICMVHKDKNRPKICQEFEVAGIGCRRIRLAKGLNTSEDFYDQPARIINYKS